MRWPSVAVKKPSADMNMNDMNMNEPKQKKAGGVPYRDGGGRGIALYIAVLGTLLREPMTAAELAPRVNCGADPLRTVLWLLFDGGLVRVHEWVKPSDVQTVWTPRFSAAPGASAPYPVAIARRFGATVARTHNRERLDRLVRLARLLTEGPMTVKEMHDALDIPYSPHLAALMRALHKVGLVHVAGYERDRETGPWAAAWAWGNKRDAVKPRPIPAQKINRRNMANRRQRRHDTALALAIAGKLTSTPWAGFGHG